MKCIIVASALLALGGCAGGGSGDGGAATGSPGGGCYPNDSCDDELSCLSGICAMLETGMDGASGAGGGDGDGDGPVINRECDPGCPAGYSCTEGACTTDAPPAENGSTCSHDSECASDSCGVSVTGEGLCYGTSGANDICGETTDCAGGQCLSKTGTAASLVCVPGVEVCQLDPTISGDCLHAAVIFCQLVQLCDTAGTGGIPVSYTDFDHCIGAECSDGGPPLSTIECADFVGNVRASANPCQ